MNILAVDTCFGALSAAVAGSRDEALVVLAEAGEPHSSGAAERLMPMIREVMQAAGLTFAGLDRLAVTIGPGTFTGVRAGVAAVRGLALAARRPVVTMTSLAVMAAVARGLLGGEHANRRLCVAVDARQVAVYLQVFGSDGQAGSPALVAVHDAAALIGREPVTVAGSGAGAVVKVVNSIGGNAEETLPDLKPHARALALAAATLAPTNRLTPLYLRALDARPQSDGTGLWAKS
ncbi:MAG TPA: tRNA (adenosine(37)-N6)-threonylcarbamoyltransferase complex dimerization subunit type 1 TsaB [Hyphomicrobiaceae bacterium]|nr:tRNA (adenosine(37)-N6)-threonylcarbamoyltransferase complex dimerization subunit type 1 TsaB [Hyphomicrobiaceae bacterium]